MNGVSEQPALRDLVDRVIVVAYREDTAVLEAALRAERFKNIVVQRATYSAAEQQYARMYRCLMNHRNACRDAAARKGWTLIVEADFVPCVGLGGWPTPVPMASIPGLKWSFLYTSATRIFWQEPGGFLRGHQSTTVCYLITGAVAEKLLEFFDEETEKYGRGSYFVFDAHLQWDLMGKGCDAYFPLRSYGEHGGLPNPEHGATGLTSNAGEHRADVLTGRLAFLPPYAQGRRLKYYLGRFDGRLRSIARLVVGKWFTPVNVRRVDGGDLVRLFAVGAKRHLTM